MILYSPGELFSQNKPQTQVDKLLQLAEVWNEKDRQELEEATYTARRTGVAERIETEDGTVYQLMRFINGMPEYYTTLNARAAVSTATNHVQEGGRTGLNLTGKGMIVGEWDAGAVLETHQELIGRVVQRDGATSIHNHAVHVAGTLIASGVNPEAKGMAPEATLWAHDWNFDASEMALAAADGLLISNHSYGSLAGWAFGDWSGQSGWHWWGNIDIDPEEDYKFGFYDNRASQWDAISYNAPYYLIVKSAGNNRNDNHTGTHFVFVPGLNEWVESNDFRQPDGGQFGYDCLPTYSNAKNILTVGAVGTVTGGYTTPQNVQMSNFSSWGPTNDGRIKPDIVGDGVGLLSSNGNSNTSYNQSSGTSMSGPNVAGSLLLLQQLHYQLFGEYMLSSSLRALAIHTADETGDGPGPDYRFGWGLLNTERAAKFLIDAGNNHLIEDQLPEGDTLEFELFGNGEDPVKISLAWIDPAATPLPPSLNDPTPRLINDLDIRLIATSGPDSGLVYSPWILNPAQPSLPATTGDNFLDNVEVIDAGVLPPGTYTVQLTHKGELQDGIPQWFSLLISAPISDCKTSLIATEINNPTCSDADNGVVTLAGEGTGPFTYSANGRDFFSENEFRDLAPGLHYFYAMDSLGCTGGKEVSLNAPTPLSAEMTDQVAVRVTSPAEHREQLAFSNSFQSSNWGGNPADGLFAGKLVPMDDGGGNFLGCGDLGNEPDLAGNIAIARRGVCQFGDKALRAQNAGATALIIVNNESGLMSMGAGNLGNQVNIPVFMILQSDGEGLLQLMEEQEIHLSLGQHIVSIPSSCNQSSDGSLHPFVTGGQPPYSFLWNTGAETESLENVSSGFFSLTVTDSAGCEFEFEMVVEAPETIRIESSIIENVICEGNADGRLEVFSTGGTGERTYLWDDGTMGSTIDSIPVGVYTVTITDQNGCMVVDSFEVSNPEPMILEEVIAHPSCPGDSTGSVSIDLRGGTLPYTYFVNGNELQEEPSNLDSGTYLIAVVDHCGLAIEDSVEIRFFDEPLVEVVSISEPECGNLSTGEILLFAEVDATPYNIIWSHGDISENPLGLSAGSYSYTLTDACQNQVTDTIEINAPEEIEVEIIELSHPTCPESEDGFILLEISGGIGELEVAWSTGDSTAELSGIGSGVFQVNVTDSLGCLYHFSFELDEPDPLSVGFTFEQMDEIISFENLSDSAIYLWDFGDGNSSTEINPVHEYAENGEYLVCLFATDNCGTAEHCETVQIVGTGTEDFSLQLKIELYPNPARDILNVELRGQQLPERIFIYNSSGERVYEFTVSEKMEIDLRTLPSGMYWLQAGNLNRSFNVSK